MRRMVADAVVRVFIDHRRPHRPHQGAAQIRARQDGCREIPRARWRKSSAASSTVRCQARWRRARPSAAPRILACTRKSRMACTGSASWCRSAILTVAQMHGLADDRARVRRWRYPSDRMAEPADFGRSERTNSKPRKRRSRRLALRLEANAIRSGLVACTGNTGCKFAASNTKRHAEEIARWCETRVALDTPVNIHLTGCHHSCAQHFVAEIGLLACKVQDSEEADPVEGYHVSDRRRFRTGCGARARALPRCQGGRCAADGRAHSQGLSLASRLARGKLHQLLRAGTRSTRSRPWLRRPPNERHAAAADPVVHSGIRAVHAGAAHLAERTVRGLVRIARRRHAAVG